METRLCATKNASWGLFWKKGASGLQVTDPFLINKTNQRRIRRENKIGGRSSVRSVGFFFLRNRSTLSPSIRRSGGSRGTGGSRRRSRRKGAEIRDRSRSRRSADGKTFRPSAGPPHRRMQPNPPPDRSIGTRQPKVRPPKRPTPTDW